jgi:hypothetical protein
LSDCRVEEPQVRWVFEAELDFVAEHVRLKACADDSDVNELVKSLLDYHV